MRGWRRDVLATSGRNRSKSKIVYEHLFYSVLKDIFHVFICVEVREIRGNGKNYKKIKKVA